MFRCMVCAHKIDGKRNKLNDKSHSYIILRYANDSKPYRLFYPIKQEVMFKSSVVFDEKNLGISLLEASYRLSSRDPLEILKNIKTTH